MKQAIKKIMRRFGLDIVKLDDDINRYTDLTPAERAVVSQVRPHTMTGIDRIVSLIQSVNYIEANKLPGDIVECGVWRGGSMMAVALILMNHGNTERELYLYDTYSGMSEPTSADIGSDGTPAIDQLDSDRKNGVWCISSLDEVKQNLASTGYPMDKIHFVVGRVEDTIPQTCPTSISLLRLDTDWYESTYHELVHLYPCLVNNGVLIIDDYGAWQGAKRAVDSYFEAKLPQPLLHRIDDTGRVALKIIG